MVVAETRIPSFAKLAPDPHAAPPSVLPGELQDEVSGVRIKRRSSSGAFPPIRPFPPHQLSVPPQQRLGAHHERGPGRSLQGAAGGCEEGPVDSAKLWPARLAPQDLQLVTQDKDLNVFRQILRPGATREPEESTHNEIEQGEQHGSSPFRI